MRQVATRTASNPSLATTGALLSLWNAQRGRCALTGDILVPGNGASLDHIVPRSRGGGNDISNLRWVTSDANTAKGALSDEAFLAMCRRIVSHADTMPLCEEHAAELDEERGEEPQN